MKTIKSLVAQKSLLVVFLASFLCMANISLAQESSESLEFSYDEITSPSTFEEVDIVGLTAHEIETSKASFCQCVSYIKNRFSLKCSAGAAKDMGGCLKSSKFKKLSSPVAGAVIIFQPGYGGGIDSTYGHIGVVTKVSYNSGKKSYTLTVRGANQGGKTWTEYSCTNVSDLSTTYTKGSDRDKKLSFYAK